MLNPQSLMWTKGWIHFKERTRVGVTYAVCAVFVRSGDVSDRNTKLSTDMMQHHKIVAKKHKMTYNAELNSAQRANIVPTEYATTEDESVQISAATCLVRTRRVEFPHAPVVSAIQS